MAARKREELIEASFELCTKSHEANRLDDTCVDGGVDERIRGDVAVKLRSEEEDRDEETNRVKNR